jgi:hypothetical protein
MLYINNEMLAEAAILYLKTRFFLENPEVQWTTEVEEEFLRLEYEMAHPQQ